MYLFIIALSPSTFPYNVAIFGEKRSGAATALPPADDDLEVIESGSLFVLTRVASQDTLDSISPTKGTSSSIEKPLFFVEMDEKSPHQISPAKKNEYHKPVYCQAALSAFDRRAAALRHNMNNADLPATIHPSIAVLSLPASSLQHANLLPISKPEIC